MTMRMFWLLLMSGFAMVSPTWAQPAADHLECYRIKDPQPKTTYVADLAGLAPEPGCLIRVPAKMACVPTSNTITSDPLPPGGGGTASPGTLLCYSVKCPKGAPPALSMQDQFGSRTVEPRAPKILCAPALEPSTPTSTTTSTTSVPTSTTSTIECGTGLTACGTACVDTQNDPSNCGGCDIACSAECSADVTGTACSAGTCAITSCTANRYDVDASCENGCECIAQSNGGTFCGGSLNLGQLNPGGAISRSGNTADGYEQWYTVTFSSNGTPSIVITGDSAYHIDVFFNCSSIVGCLNPRVCNPAPGSTVQIGVRTSRPICSSFVLQLRN